ncbi:DUF1156 domain-containing protein [Thermodesulfitimonas sp.]
MIPKECRRLIEVDFPIGVVSRHADYEKNNIRAGHPKSLHQWWARRPLAACRAVLLGLLLPDPCDPFCPPEFKAKAWELLSEFYRPAGKSDVVLRKTLLKFIADFANWEASSHPLYLKIARGLVQAAHPEETPLVVDPFAGGGSIPLEALRLGCEVFASDLNPVACLILKVLLEDIPRYGTELTEKLRQGGREIEAELEDEIGQFYPPDPDGAKPIAYLWARTVRCEAPHCGAEIPLVRSFWLSKKAGRKRALRYQVVRPAFGAPQLHFEIFTPVSDADVPPGTVARAKARCPACGTVLSPERVRAQLAAQRGGADVIFDENGKRIAGARLLAVVTLKPNATGRHYRLPTEHDYKAVFESMMMLKEKTRESLSDGLSIIPDEPTPAGGGSGAGRAFSVQKYGILQWGDLFTARQNLALATLTAKVRLVKDPGLQELFALMVSELAERCSSLAWLNLSWGKPMGTFARHALPMVWDFLELLPIGRDGQFDKILNTVLQILNFLQKGIPTLGYVDIADACASPLPSASATVWFTDPPYYDAVPYADLSDFFFVWLKRAFPECSLLRDPFDPQNSLTPKTPEIVQDETKQFNGRPKNKEFFEERMAKAFEQGRRVLRDDGVGCVIFAHKTTEGWEALLSGMLQAGWTITASWPIATEMSSRLRAQESAALATSVHLVCRPRPRGAGVGDWAEVKAEMEQRVREWMARLLEEGIRGADAIFSCIGPALGVFSRYERVETPAGYAVPLGGNPEAAEPHERGFLSYVFEAVSREALRQVLGDAETEGFEEDARLTALFLWTLQTTRTNGNNGRNNNGERNLEELDEDEEKPARKKGGLVLPFDTFIRITRPMGIHYQNWLGRVIEIEKGIVRLIPVSERRRLLFDEESVSLPVEWGRKGTQVTLSELIGVPEPPPKPTKRAAKRLENLTTLDRLHQAMLLFGGGQSASLRRLLEEERRQGKRFERLALALTALYPEKSQERRWIEGLQAMIPR